jgi:hypothetical protein
MEVLESVDNILCLKRLNVTATKQGRLKLEVLTRDILSKSGLFSKNTMIFWFFIQRETRQHVGDRILKSTPNRRRMFGCDNSFQIRTSLAIILSNEYQSLFNKIEWRYDLV